MARGEQRGDQSEGRVPDLGVALEVEPRGERPLTCQETSLELSQPYFWTSAAQIGL
jgi:hypothetical protein